MGMTAMGNDLNSQGFLKVVTQANALQPLEEVYDTLSLLAHYCEGLTLFSKMNRADPIEALPVASYAILQHSAAEEGCSTLERLTQQLGETAAKVPSIASFLPPPR